MTITKVPCGVASAGDFIFRILHYSLRKTLRFYLPLRTVTVGSSFVLRFSSLPSAPHGDRWFVLRFSSFVPLPREGLGVGCPLFLHLIDDNLYVGG